MNTGMKMALVGCALLAGLAVNEFWPTTTADKNATKASAQYKKPAGFTEAPAWLAQSAASLYKAQVEKDNATAKDQFGPLYIDSSRVDVLDVKSVDCFGLPQTVNTWSCDLKTSVRLGGKTIAAREVEVQIAMKNNEPTILGVRQLKF